MTYVNRMSHDKSVFGMYNNHTRSMVVNSHNDLANHVDLVRAQADSYGDRLANQDAINTSVESILHPLQGRVDNTDAAIAQLRAENAALRAQVTELTGQTNIIRENIERLCSIRERRLRGVDASIASVRAGLDDLRTAQDRFASRVYTHLINAATLGSTWSTRVQSQLGGLAKRAAHDLRCISIRMFNGGLLPTPWRIANLENQQDREELERQPEHVRAEIEDAVNSIRTREDQAKLAGRIALALARG